MPGEVMLEVFITGDTPARRKEADFDREYHSLPDGQAVRKFCILLKPTTTAACFQKLR
jgi:hypothetical protein